MLVHLSLGEGHSFQILQESWIPQGLVVIWHSNPRSESLIIGLFEAEEEKMVAQASEGLMHTVKPGSRRKCLNDDSQGLLCYEMGTLLPVARNRN